VPGDGQFAGHITAMLVWPGVTGEAVDDTGSLDGQDGRHVPQLLEGGDIVLPQN
jgi:hypothetical protein